MAAQLVAAELSGLDLDTWIELHAEQFRAEWEAANLPSVH